MRKPLSMVVFDGYLIVAFDDGSLWQTSDKTPWTRIKDTPQDQNEFDKLKAEKEDLIKSICFYEKEFVSKDQIISTHDAIYKDFEKKIEQLNDYIRRLKGDVIDEGLQP